MEYTQHNIYNAHVRQSYVAEAPNLKLAGCLPHLPEMQIARSVSSLVQISLGVVCFEYVWVLLFFMGHFLDLTYIIPDVISSFLSLFFLAIDLNYPCWIILYLAGFSGFGAMILVLSYGLHRPSQLLHTACIGLMLTYFPTTIFLFMEFCLAVYKGSDLKFLLSDGVIFLYIIRVCIGLSLLYFAADVLTPGVDRVRLHVRVRRDPAPDVRSVFDSSSQLTHSAGLVDARLTCDADLHSFDNLKRYGVISITLLNAYLVMPDLDNEIGLRVIRSKINIPSSQVMCDRNTQQLARFLRKFLESHEEYLLETSFR